MSTPTTQQRHRRRLRILGAAAVLLSVLSLVFVVYESTKSEPRQLAIFAGGVPGSDDGQADAAIDFAADHHIDEVIMYSFLNAPRDASTVLLDHALRRHVKIIISIKDLLGPTDLDTDPANLAFHRQYGLNTNAQVTGVIEEFDGNDAVWGYYTGDELPAETAGDDGLAKWLGPLSQRNDQVHRLSKKPTMASFYRNPRSFLKQVAGVTDHTMSDYYPYPDGPGQAYGPESDMKQVAADTAAVAGDKSWSAIQGFSYYANEPNMIDQFNFPKVMPAGSNRGAPKAAWMINSAKLALDGGARNLALFSFDYAAVLPAVGTEPSQLDEIAKAVAGIRNLPEWG